MTATRADFFAKLDKALSEEQAIKDKRDQAAKDFLTNHVHPFCKAAVPLLKFYGEQLEARGFQITQVHGVDYFDFSIWYSGKGHSTNYVRLQYGPTPELQGQYRLEVMYTDFGVQKLGYSCVFDVACTVLAILALETKLQDLIDYFDYCKTTKWT